MDQLPYDFYERVAALWKCCEEDAPCSHSRCVDANVPDCLWTMKSKKKRIEFFIGRDAGKWNYGFCNPYSQNVIEGILTLRQLQEYPDLQNFRISQITVYEVSPVARYQNDDYELMKPLDVDVQQLLTFVAFLSNETQLELQMDTVEDFNNPEGATLLKCLESLTFSSIKLANDFQIYNPLLESQFLARNPVDISIELDSTDPNADFFIENLRNGNIKRLSVEGDRACYPPRAMEGIIENFLQNPEDYEQAYFDIMAYFDPETKRLLKRKQREGVCVLWKIEKHDVYRFEAYDTKLKKNRCMRVRPHEVAFMFGM